MAVGIGIGFVVLVMLIAGGYYFRSEFYAVGDPRTRWRALGAFIGLLAAEHRDRLRLPGRACADCPRATRSRQRLQSAVLRSGRA